MQAFPGVSSSELEVGEHTGRMEINRSAFALVRVVVRGGVELPAFRFSGEAYAKLMSIVRVLRRSLVAAVSRWLLLLLSPLLSAVPRQGSSEARHGWRHLWVLRLHGLHGQHRARLSGKCPAPLDARRGSSTGCVISVASLTSRFVVVMARQTSPHAEGCQPRHEAERCCCVRLSSLGQQG